MSEQFDEIARKAARGELSPAERDWLDSFLREHPARRADLEWDQAFHAKLAEKIESMPAMPGWERTEKALLAAQASPRESRNARPRITRAPGILDRLSDWLGSLFGMALNMQAVAATLVIAQAGVIGMLVWQDRAVETSEIRSGAQSDAPRGPLLRVSFRPDIREAELRRALADIGGEIVAGPGQIGVYLVRVKDVELGTAAEKLRATGMTALVERYEAKP